jgi:hypothetical protein
LFKILGLINTNIHSPFVLNHKIKKTKTQSYCAALGAEISVFTAHSTLSTTKDSSWKTPSTAFSQNEKPTYCHGCGSNLANAPLKRSLSKAVGLTGSFVQKNHTL